MEKWYTSTSKINPEWTKYNEMFNEGGEGYNPHSKYIGTDRCEAKRQLLNKFYTVAEARETLQKLKEALPLHTDQEKIKGCKSMIEFFETHLKDAR